jgi:hypothetical protein
MTVRDYFGDELGTDYYYSHPTNYKSRGVFSIDEPSPTITSISTPVAPGYQKHKNDPVDPRDPRVRVLTTTERARVQTFPVDYVWTECKTHTERMIGNAVPPKLAEVVGRAILEYNADVPAAETFQSLQKITASKPATEPASVLLAPANENIIGRVAVIDADLAERRTPKIPNLACLHLSGYYKQHGYAVELKLGYDNLETYDKVFISKVFTKTSVPTEVLSLPNVEYGGTGFFDDKAPPLPHDVEHSMPDYDLYADWVKSMIGTPKNPRNPDSSLYKTNDFKYYTDYSIGYLSRGCFRQCGYCVNRNTTSSEMHSSVNEFLDVKRPKIMLLDDNIFACTRHWRSLIAEVKATGKQFVFKQGLDFRLLTDGKIHEMMSWRYDNAFYFAFDNLEDKDLIEKNLKRIFELYPDCKKKFMCYVLCCYDRDGSYDNDFWLRDVESVFERCFILTKYSVSPYVMRYEQVENSPYKGMYINLAGWANQPTLFKKHCFAMFSIRKSMGEDDFNRYGYDCEKYLAEGGEKRSSWRYMEDFTAEHPEIADRYFHTVPDSLLEYGSGVKYEVSSGTP